MCPGGVSALDQPVLVPRCSSLCGSWSLSPLSCVKPIEFQAIGLFSVAVLAFIPTSIIAIALPVCLCFAPAFTASCFHLFSWDGATVNGSPAPSCRQQAAAAGSEGDKFSSLFSPHLLLCIVNLNQAAPPPSASTCSQLDFPGCSEPLCISGYGALLQELPNSKTRHGSFSLISLCPNYGFYQISHFPGLPPGFTGSFPISVQPLLSNSLPGFTAWPWKSRLFALLPKGGTINTGRIKVRCSDGCYGFKSHCCQCIPGI